MSDASLTASTRARRQEYERRQRTRSIAIAAGSTVIVVGLIVWLLPKTSGWQKVRQSFFNWAVFRRSFGSIAEAFWLDVRIFLLSAPCIVVLGLLVAMARNVRAPALYPLRLFATLYTDVVRGVPVILWITMLGFGIPGLLQTREWYGKLIIPAVSGG